LKHRFQLIFGHARRADTKFLYIEFVARRPRERQLLGREVIHEIGDHLFDLLDRIYNDRNDGTVVDARDRAARVVGREVRIDCRRIFGNEA
jgi:hypothetical protein